MISFFKDSKNRIMAYVILFVIVVIGVNIVLRMENNQLESEHKSMEFKYDKLLDALEYNHSDDFCYLWVMKDGVGFASPTGYCAQLKHNCNADYHNLDCNWVKSVSLNNTIEGCECVLG